MDTTVSPYHNFDAVAAMYDESRLLPPEAQQMAAQLLLKIADLKPGQVFLDAGTGTGRFALPLAKQGIPVVGVDISERMLGRLSRKRAEWESHHSLLQLRLLRGDLRRLPLASGQFGAALLVHILHLIADWQDALSEILRVLTPGGVLFLAKESGQYSQTRNVYFDLAKSRDALPPPIGVESVEKACEWLMSNGMKVEQVDEGTIRWPQRRHVGETIEMLRRRTWARQWGIPDADHQAIIAETEAWAWGAYGALDVMEEAEAILNVWTARRQRQAGVIQTIAEEGAEVGA